MLNLPTEIFKKVEKICFGFIWNSSEKIKRNTLIGPIVEGGISMIDLELQVKSLKAAWIPRFLKSQDKPWAIFAQHYTTQYGPDNLVVKMSFNSLVSFPQLQLIPQFYQEIIIAYNSSKPVEKFKYWNEIKDVLLWGNRSFKYEKHTLYSKAFINSNSISVKHVFNKNGEIKGQEIYTKVLNKIDYFRIVYLLYKVVKPIIKSCLPDSMDIEKSNIEIFDPCLRSRSKYFYNIFIQNKFVKPLSEDKWKTELSLETNYDFKNIYHKNIYKYFDKKVAEFKFKFKFLNRIIPTGQRLYKWKKVESPYCIYCMIVKILVLYGRL